MDKGKQDSKNTLLNENEFEVIFEYTMDGILVTDDNGLILKANETYLNMSGYALNEITKLHIWDLNSGFTKEYILQILSDGKTNKQIFETKHKRKDGSEFDCQVLANYAKLQNGKGFRVAVVRDISEIKKQDDIITNSLNYSKYLNEILLTIDAVNNVLLSDKSTPDILNEICTLIAKHGIYNLAWIGEAVDGEINIIAHSYDSNDYLKHLKLKLDPKDPTYNGPSVQSIIQNSTKVTQSFNVEYYSQWKNYAENSGSHSSICIPLREPYTNMPFGQIAIYASRNYGFIKEEITMLENLARNISYFISSHKKAYEYQLSLVTDNLTNLPNKNALEIAINKSIKPQILLININRFKDINAVYGKNAGDYILQSCAKLFKNLVAKQSLGRLHKLHSDIFAVLLNESSNKKDAEKFIASLSGELSKQVFIYDEVEISISISAGFSSDSNRVFENAEIALNEAKNNKEIFISFTKSMCKSKEYEQNIGWYKIIKDAINDNRIVPYFQKIVSNKDKNETKYEALARLIMPGGAVITPDRFLVIAKRTGLYKNLMKNMLIQVIEKVKKYKIYAGINLYADDILDSKIKDYIFEVIKENGCGNYIVIEILESESVSDYKLVSEFISSLKTLGCKFAIDDFGSGYSNFEHIINLNIDYLKIDGSLIKNIDKDKNSQIIVKNIQNFANEMGLQTVAEFVCCKKVYDVINKIGIDYSQGFYFDEPKPLD